MAWRANSNDLEIPGGEKIRIYFLIKPFKEKKILNPTPSSKVDVGEISVSEGSSTASKQLKPKKKQMSLEKYMIVLGNFVWSIYMLLYLNNLSFSNAL